MKNSLPASRQFHTKEIGGKENEELLAILLSILILATVVSAFADEDELVWWGWPPGSSVNESFIEEFNKTYPDIKVTWKQVSIDDYDATIRPAPAYGKGVDICKCSACSSNGGIEVFASQALDLMQYPEAGNLFLSQKAAIPEIAAYLCMQKNFERGMSAGALK